MFTEKKYGELIDILKKRFIFAGYGEEHQAPSIIIRHDIDHSPQRALALAKIEHNRKIKTTYHVMVSSVYYNIFEIKVIKILQEIIKYGHSIGLHFDMDCLGDTDKSNSKIINERIKFEINIIETLLGVKATSLSFHNYTIHKEFIAKNKYISKRINSSSDSINLIYQYISDSNGIWKNKTLQDLAIDPSITKIHALIHPEWWTKEKSSPIEKFYRCVNGRALANIKQYEELLKKEGRFKDIRKKIGL